MYYAYGPYTVYRPYDKKYQAKTKSYEIERPFTEAEVCQMNTMHTSIQCFPHQCHTHAQGIIVVCLSATGQQKEFDLETHHAVSPMVRG